MLTASLAEFFSRVLLRSWVDESLMTYSGRTMAWPKRNAHGRNSSGICPAVPLARAARGGIVDEILDRAAIRPRGSPGCSTRRITSFADDNCGRSASRRRARKETACRPRRGWHWGRRRVRPGDTMSTSRLQQREQRRQLRNHGVIVIAGIGESALPSAPCGLPAMRCDRWR